VKKRRRELLGDADVRLRRAGRESDAATAPQVVGLTQK